MPARFPQGVGFIIDTGTSNTTVWQNTGLVIDNSILDNQKQYSGNFGGALKNGVNLSFAANTTENTSAAWTFETINAPSVNQAQTSVQ